jgi:hypothetical protein
MHHLPQLKRSRLLQVSVLLLLLASLSLWSQLSPGSAALARSKPKPTPTPTTTATATPTPTPTAFPTPTATPTPTPITGTWQVIPSPAIDVSNSTFGARLNAVAVVTASDVWAVGYGPQPGGPAYAKQTLIEHWDGTSWHIVPSPNPPSAYAEVELDGVFAVTATDVWAVGFGDNPSGVVSPLDITLIEHWDGTSWSIVPSPNPDPDENQLHAISGAASNDLWAVGQRGDGNTCCPVASLIEHWNGTSWSVVPNPGRNYLDGVTALATTNVWAVAFNAAGGDIIEHWDGTAWATVASPTEYGDSISLRAVTAVSATDLWAVGDLQDAYNNRYYSVTEHWDGTAWTAVGLVLQDCTLRGVTAPGPNDVWAVDASGLMQTQHWDGATESVVSTPNPGIGSGLNGVAAVSAGDLWAVGWTGTTAGVTPLIEQFTQA